MEIYDHDNQPWVLYVDKDYETIFLYQTNDKELYVAKNVIKFLINIFSIDENQIKPLIGDWFQERNDLKTNKVLPWDFSDASDWKKVVRWETKKRLS